MRYKIQKKNTCEIQKTKYKLIIRFGVCLFPAHQTLYKVLKRVRYKIHIRHTHT